MGIQVFKQTKPQIKARYGKDITDMVMDRAKEELDRLITANSGESKAVAKHTVGKIYPTIALYRGLIKAGIDQAEAIDFMDIALSRNAEGKAKAMQMMCKLPCMMRKMPTIFKKVTLSTFGEEQGFEAKFYDTPASRCKFDMTRCLYVDVCTKNGCPELVKCFCHTDDVTDGNIHPKLRWNRTKTMGEGGDVCDFDLYIMDDEGNPLEDK